MTEIPDARPQNNHRVPAVQRAFAVLRCLAEGGPAPLVDLVNQTGLHKSTVYYTLKALVAEDAVVYDEKTRLYSLGAELIRIGTVASGQFNHVTIARPHLIKLLDRYEITIVLYRRDNAKITTVVDKLERPEGVRVALKTGIQAPIQVGSVGRTFHAFDPIETVSEVLSDGLQAYTQHSIVDPDSYIRELIEVRRKGWSYDIEGYALGVTGIAAPIREAGGQVRLVAAAVGYSSLLTMDLIEEIGAALKRTCDRISAELGYAKPLESEGT